MVGGGGRLGRPCIDRGRSEHARRQTARRRIGDALLPGVCAFCPATHAPLSGFLLKRPDALSIVIRMRTHSQFVAACVTALILWAGNAPAQEKATVFSGPQAGEKMTEFKVVDVVGDAKGREWAVLDRHQGKPLTIVFVHGIERSIVPLLTTIDQYAHEKTDLLGTTIVFLSDDRVESEKRLPMVAQSLRLQSPVALSVDGAEGPGNYGLNKQCLMTVVVAKDGKATANFALVQPGIVDAPAVIAAMAQACGDAKPPTAESLLAKR